MARKNIILRAAVFGLAAVLASCGGRVETKAPVGEPPSWEQLKNATYYGLQLPGAPVALQDGFWERVRTSVTLAEGFRATGDLTGDGRPDAVVILGESGGGSGSFQYLAAVGYRDGRLENLATVPLGDRVQVRRVRIAPGELEADVVQAGPGDPACCPGELVTRRWRYEPAGLHELPPGEAKRFNLAALEGSQWTLHSLDAKTPLAGANPVTLTVMETGFSGSTGCNNFSAAAESGEMGVLKVKEPLASKLPCEGDVAALEQQFLAALEKVDSMAFQNGRLALNYRDGGDVKTMTFDPVQP